MSQLMENIIFNNDYKEALIELHNSAMYCVIIDRVENLFKLLDALCLARNITSTLAYPESTTAQTNFFRALKDFKDTGIDLQTEAGQRLAAALKRIDMFH